MKAIVGVDGDGLYGEALTLLGRLGFPAAEVELIHTEEPLPAYPDAGFIASPEIQESLHATAEKTLAEAVERARAAGLNPSHHEYVTGPVSATLMIAAEEANADLIAIGSHQKSRYSSLFLGSVGRGLTISAKESILISKGVVAKEGPLTAVFATDYSDYAKRSLRLLADMHPGGLGQLVLVTAVADSDHREPSVMRFAESEDRERQFFLDEGKKAVEWLATLGIAAEAYVLTGDVHSVIEQAMRERSADLLIMGAHGHGFFERLVLGSTSLAEALATHHPLLILRPR